MKSKEEEIQKVGISEGEIGKKMEEEVIQNREIISQLQSENKRYQTIVYEHEVR